MRRIQTKYYRSTTVISSSSRMNTQPLLYRRRDVLLFTFQSFRGTVCSSPICCKMTLFLLLVCSLSRFGDGRRGMTAQVCGTSEVAWNPEVIATYNAPSSYYNALLSKWDSLFGIRKSSTTNASSPVLATTTTTIRPPSPPPNSWTPTTAAVLSSSSVEAAYKAIQHRLSQRISLASQLLQQRKMTLQIAASNIAASTTRHIHDIQTKAVHVVHRFRTTWTRREPTTTNALVGTSTTTTTTTNLFAPKERETIIQQTHRILDNVETALQNEDIWELINECDGVKVWRTFENIKEMHSSTSTNKNKSSNNDVAVIRSEVILNSSPQKVYQLFMDNSRVHEYNENCVELHDIEYLNHNTKVNWCATGKFGPFKARDFVTAVHFRELVGRRNRVTSSGVGYVSIAANIQHSKLPPTTHYVRSEIQLAATLMIPLPGQPNKTKFIQVTQVGQLGGVADSKMAKKITQGLAEKAPVDFCKKFDQALQTAPKPKPNRVSNGLPFPGIGSLSEV